MRISMTFEFRSMLSGPNDHCNAYPDDPRGRGRDRGLRLVGDAAPHVPDVGRVEAIFHRDHRP